MKIVTEVWNHMLESKALTGSVKLYRNNVQNWLQRQGLKLTMHYVSKHFYEPIIINLPSENLYKHFCTQSYEIH